jgi:hypothetical protein
MHAVKPHQEVKTDTITPPMRRIHAATKMAKHTIWNFVVFIIYIFKALNKKSRREITSQREDEFDGFGDGHHLTLYI